MEFPVFSTKIIGDQKIFDLTDPTATQAYFQHKAGDEIIKLKTFLAHNTFVAYLMGKKNAGKGTYTKYFLDIFGVDRVAHISVGDLVRAADSEVHDPVKRTALAAYLQKNYRGFYSVEQILQSQGERGVGKALLPTEYILALLKREIMRVGHKAIFIDGLPRTLDQISYSLFFRELIGFRDDPDFFVLIQIPETVIDERLKYRRVCPKCQTPRNLKLLITKKFGWDSDKQEFYLQCDNPACQGARMVAKEGDDQGIELIKARLVTDGELMDQALLLYGIPKVLLRNSVPVMQKSEVDDYELTPEYIFKQENGIARIETKPWIIKDDQGVASYSLLAPAVVVAMIKQMTEILGL